MSPRLELAMGQLNSVRNYTLRLLANTDPDEWFRQPHEGVTHIAWQVGHLAMAEYRLALERIRGRRPEDQALISDDFLGHFRRTSIPDPAATSYPNPEVIRTTFEVVHQQTLQELRELSDAELDQTPIAPPHPQFTTKLGSLFWCAQHEMLHAGQIGLLRRLLGHPPLW